MNRHLIDSKESKEDTNLLSDSGHMGSIYLQFPGLTEEQMPTDKASGGVIVLKVEGLTVVSTAHFLLYYYPAKILFD